MTSPAPTGHERADKSVRVTRSVLFCGYNPHIPVQRKQRRLPHWSQPRATYFITFRLGDSIPANLQRQWVSEREIWLRLHPKPWNIETELEYHERFDVRMEEWLDRGFGQCHLRQPNFRVAVEKHLLHFDDQRYDMMPLC